MKNTFKLPKKYDNFNYGLVIVDLNNIDIDTNSAEVIYFVSLNVKPTKKDKEEIMEFFLEEYGDEYPDSDVQIQEADSETLEHFKNEFYEYLIKNN